MIKLRTAFTLETGTTIPSHGRELDRVPKALSIWAFTIK